MKESKNQNELDQLKRINDQLIEENEVLREQLRELQVKSSSTKFGKWFAKRAALVYMGKGLKGSFFRLYSNYFFLPQYI